MSIWPAQEFVAIIFRLRDSLKDSQSISQLFAEVGWNVPPESVNESAVQSLFGITLEFTSTTLSSLLRQIGNDDAQAGKAAYTALIAHLASLIKSIKQLPTTTASKSDLNLPLTSVPEWTEFSTELMHRLIIDHLASRMPLLLALLLAARIVEETNISNVGDTRRISYIKKTIHWDRLLQVIRNPSVLSLASGSGSFDSTALIPLLQSIVNTLGASSELVQPKPNLVRAYYGIDGLPSRVKVLRIPIIRSINDDGSEFNLSIILMPVRPQSDLSQPPAAIVATTEVDGELGTLLSEFPFAIEVAGGFERNGAIMVYLEPGRSPSLLPASMVSNSLDANVSVEYKPEKPAVIIGTEDSSRLQLSSALVAFRAFGPIDDPDVLFESNIRKGELFIDISGGDSFIQEILGSNQSIGFKDLQFIWSSKKGLQFGERVGFETIIPIDRSIGLARFDTIAFAIRAASNGLDLVAGLSGKATLGPILISVENIGLKLSVTYEKNRQPPGIFGDLDMNFGFKAPDGLGIAIDSNFANGGGYLYFNESKSEYTGIFNIEIRGIALTAIGILTTKRPDGEKSFSLLIIISAEFQPIQLGFGFKLNGVGGLLGLNRTVALELLREGIKNRTLDSILFPPNPIENAPKIISDLKRVFPYAEGRFIFGPMAKIGWGTPTVIIADVGLVLEVPDPIRLILLGKIKAVLPKEDLALIQLNMDVLGVLDFERSTVSIDATLYDSRLLQYALSGDMALRAGWGTNPLFALSVGGLNPRFQPPPGFPTLSRLQVSMGVGNNPRLNLQAYLAITSNTVQFGALLELYAEASRFNIKGHLGFDCLFQLDPFEFIADISASVAFRKGNKTLAAVNLRGTLSGPRPWRARGKASISLLFVKASVRFDQQWGDASKVRLPEINVWEQLKPALEDPRNWSSVLPPVTSRSVGYHNTGKDPEKVIVVDPFCSLTMRQKVAPLNKELNKFGNSAPAASNSYFNIKQVTVDGISLHTGKEYDLFAPAQFKEMSDDQKLTQPEFVKMESGVNVGADEARTADKDTIKEVEMELETYIIDLKGKKKEDKKIQVSPAQADAMSEFGALKRSRWWNSGEDKYFPDVPEEAPTVIMEDEYFVIAEKRDLTRTERDGILKERVRLTRSEAYDIMNEYIRDHPEDRDNLQVIPAYEEEVIQAT